MPFTPRSVEKERARINTSAILTSSLGWKEPKPGMRIQFFAPLISCPMAAGKSSSATHTGVASAHRIRHARTRRTASAHSANIATPSARCTACLRPSAGESA